MKILFHYGFDNNALQLITSYFANLYQVVKYNKTLSPKEEIRLGVPQGLILGPLFFLILINDWPYLINLLCKLFADDTTLYKEGIEINLLVTKLFVI